MRTLLMLGGSDIQVHAIDQSRELGLRFENDHSSDKTHTTYLAIQVPKMTYRSSTSDAA